MKKSFKVIVLFFTISLFLIIFTDSRKAVTSNITQEEKVEIPEREKYFVKKVIDGDTIIVISEGKEEFVRLIGIDSSEIDYKNSKSECFANEAKEKVVKTLANKTVFLENDLSQDNRDKYDRLLRYVFLEDKTNFNKLLIEEGFAKEFTFIIPYKYQMEFKKAEEKARDLKIGLWKECYKK